MMFPYNWIFIVFFLVSFQMLGQNVISNVKENVVNVQDGGSSVNSGIIINNGKVSGDGITLKGNGDFVKAVRELPAFESVSVRGSFEVDIKVLPSAKNELQISADANLLDNVKSIVENGQLKIFTEASYSCSKKISLALKISSLKTLSCEGANNIAAGPLSGILTLKSPGGCNIIRLDGSVRELQAMLGGACKLDALKLSADKAVFDLSGASECFVNVKGPLKVKASGAAKVFYEGTPSEIVKELGGAAKMLPYERKDK